jgi:hypothetical protein
MTPEHCPHCERASGFLPQQKGFLSSLFEVETGKIPCLLRYIEGSSQNFGAAAIGPGSLPDLLVISQRTTENARKSIFLAKNRLICKPAERATELIPGCSPG